MYFDMFMYMFNIVFYFCNFYCEGVFILFFLQLLVISLL